MDSKRKDIDAFKRSISERGKASTGYIVLGSIEGTLRNKTKTDAEKLEDIEGIIDSFNEAILEQEQETGEFKMYSLEEVENILGVTRRSIYNYIKDGKLKAVKMGKYWRVKREDLREFIDRGTN